MRVMVSKTCICDRICENRPPCEVCTLEIRAFEHYDDTGVCLGILGHLAT